MSAFSLTVCRSPRPLQDLLHPVFQLDIRRGGVEGQGGQVLSGGQGGQGELAKPVPQNHCRCKHWLLPREGEGERGARPTRTHPRTGWREILRSKYILIVEKEIKRVRICWDQDWIGCLYLYTYLFWDLWEWFSKIKFKSSIEVLIKINIIYFLSEFICMIFI